MIQRLLLRGRGRSVPGLEKRELVCLLLFTCNYVVSVRRGFLFFCVLEMGYVILFWHSLRLPYNYVSTMARGYKYFLCSTQLSMKFYLLISIKIAEVKEISGLNHQSRSIIQLINVQMPTLVGI